MLAKSGRKHIHQAHSGAADSLAQEAALFRVLEIEITNYQFISVSAICDSTFARSVRRILALG
jgi:hypothetical protein